MKSTSRRTFIRQASLLAAAAPVLAAGRARGAAATAPAGIVTRNTPETLTADPRVTLEFGDEHMAMSGGQQPFMLGTAAGTLVVQGQVPRKRFPQKRIFYPSAIGTAISRDGGREWAEFPLKPGDNGVNFEGGVVQLRDGTILALETYVTPSERPDEGIGLLFTSTDDYRTLEGPVEVTFELPHANFHGSTDDGGRPHAAMRLHRRILELPDGDLLTTIYGWQEGDDRPASYIPTMKKTRVMLVRSKDRGRHWSYVSTVAVDPEIGTEGFGEAAIARVSRGPHAGRLICFMRTGRELYECVSDDGGGTWSKAKPRTFADLDVNRTELWAEQFKDALLKGKRIAEDPTEFIGAVVDPDVLEMRDGTLVTTFGVRVPPRYCFSDPKHPLNGNYIAFSLDHGETWPHVVRLTSGIWTTHYTAVVETPTDGTLFVAYDYGHWGNKDPRYIYGRTVKVGVKGA